MTRSRMRGALRFILVVALCGLSFSGVLTYREVFQSAAGCPAPGAPGTILGYPACVYGFVMYLVITVAAAIGLTGHGVRVRGGRSWIASRDAPVVRERSLTLDGHGPRTF